MLQGLVSMLRDPQLLADHGQKIIEGSNPTDVLFGLNPEALAVSDIKSEAITGAATITHSRPIVDSLGLW